MRIGVPKEIKNHEYRVGATPAKVSVLCGAGHKVLVETHAGTAIGFTDEVYRQAGATIVPNAQAVYADAEMILKVKEPQPSEYGLLKEGQILFCYLHLAPDPQQTEALLKSKVVGVAYETVTDARGRLPLLTPMSEIAGRISIQAGATALQLSHKGKGVLLGGVPGVRPGKVVVIGAGIVGTHAARMAMGLGAQVIVFDNRLDRLREIEEAFNFRLTALFSTQHNIEREIKDADLVIGAVLIPGKAAPKLITRKMLEQMQPGSVVVDVAIDQGGCMETSRPTTHEHPTYVEHGVIHYCVTNMPGAVARTSTEALTNATLPYTLAMANLGLKKALEQDAGLRAGLNVYLGHVTNKPVAEDLGYEYLAPESALKR